jgi:hypothetical protein
LFSFSHPPSISSSNGSGIVPFIFYFF